MELVKAELGSDLVAPTRGINADLLRRNYKSAIDAVKAAGEEVSLTYPLTADFILQPIHILDLARMQHRARLAALAAILEELTELMGRMS
jgi:hypothetical protein